MFKMEGRMHIQTELTSFVKATNNMKKVFIIVTMTALSVVAMAQNDTVTIENQDSVCIKKHDCTEETAKCQKEPYSSQREISGNEAIEIGYGTQRKDRLTTSVSQLEINEKEIGGYTNIFDYLRGKVPGVSVIGSGPSAKIQIRGINSINCSTDPLILVDDVPTTDISLVNPNDVRSVTVLKDASSSIYGTRGSNGVILIKTKR